MKKKRIFSFLAVMLLLISLLGGCKTEESAEPVLPAEGQQQPEETVPSQQWKDISLAIYPVDLQFTECAEVTFSADVQIPPPADTSPALPEGTAPTEETVPETGTAPDGSVTIQEKNASQVQNNEGNDIGDPSVIQEPASSSGIMVFRNKKTDMATGTTVYHIQVQKQDGDGITILTGLLRPDEGVEWDEGEAPVDSNVLLKKKLTDVLLGELQWIPCAQAEVYAYNQNLTKCNLSGRNAIYANADYTVFQVQSYDEEGLLYSVAELSQSSAKLLLEKRINPIPWSDDIYPVMHLSVPVESENEEPDISNLIDTYESQIADLQLETAQSRNYAVILIGALLLLAVTNVASLVCLFRRKKRRSKQKAKRGTTEPIHADTGNVRGFGTVHNIGSRSGQQDSFDVINCPAGMLAVVADGMGGLTDGDKVSQKIVATMRADSVRIRPGQTDKVLCQMVAHANQEVNRMLGTARQYKCGSTLLAVLVENNTMQWITVGDSRIYLYRGGSLIQINREHIYSAELLERAINGKISFAEALRDPQADRLSSFVGMGELKHVDICMNRLKLCRGDRILLMSDGVFNTLSNEEIAGVIQSASDAAGAAAQLEQKVLQKNSPNQDNFTCVILEV